MTTTIVDLLANTLSPDQRVREDATKQLDQYSVENFGSYLGFLCQELANDSNPTHIRSAAGLMVKNTLAAKESVRKEEYTARWLQTDINIRSQVKNMCIQTLASPDQRSGIVAAQIISAISEIEIPRNEWPDLMNLLISNVGTENANLKIATLQTIGFICDAIDPDVLTSQANAILTAVAQGARKEETNNTVRFAAIQALFNSLEFVRQNFENDMERNYIMQIVCEGTQCPDIQVQVASFQCLVRIMGLYYEKMSMYMKQALFHLTIAGMKHENQNVALQAIEFWSTVCEEELAIQHENEEAYLNDEPPARDNYKFAEGALNEILPVLLWLLTKKEEEDDEDEWNVSMAAATCLGLFAATVGDPIVGQVVQFVEQNIRNTDWRFREAAVMAFGSIMEGPTRKILGPLCQTALRTICEMIVDPSEAVKDTTAWTLGRVCETLSEFISSADLPVVIQALNQGLCDTPRVASNCAWAIINLSENVTADIDMDAPTYALSPYFDGLVSSLLAAAEREGQDGNFRASAYEAISSLVIRAPRDTLPSIQKLTSAMTSTLERSINVQSQLVGADEKRVHVESQANICSVMTSIIRRVQKEIAPLADHLMQLLLTIMSSASKSSTLLEDAFLTIGALCTAVEGDFIRYMDSFMPFLCAALQNHEEHAMCSIAVGTIGDMSRALNEKLAPYCDSIMNLLMTDLSSNVLHRDVKPVILSAFGDVALAIGGAFEQYLNVIMTVLQQAAGTTSGMPNTEGEMYDYFLVLRESIIEAFVGITQGLKTDNKTNALTPHVQMMFQFLQMCYDDDGRDEASSRAMLGLLGDIADAFPPGQLKMLYTEPWVDAFVKQIRSQRQVSSSTKEVARWAREQIKRQVA